MGLLILTAYTEQPSQKGVKTLTTPKVVYLEPTEVADFQPKKNSAGTIIGTTVVYGASKKVLRKYTVGERPFEVEVASDPTTTNPYAQSKNLGVAASGAAFSTATALTSYLNVVTAATVTTANGVGLPSASGARKAIVVINAASTALSVYPSASEFIDAGASNVAVTLGVGSRKHFYASASNTWKTATDNA